MVCYINGKPAKKMYRKFNLPEEVAGDDYHSMVHVTARRYSRLKEEGQDYPDLILTDGGLAQVHATNEGLTAAGVSIPVFGLFKNDKHQTSGLIDAQGKEYELDRKPPLFFLLMRMQDEVHRYAITFHKQKRAKHNTESELDHIKGIGAATKTLLLKKFKSLKRIKEADIATLTEVVGASKAQLIKDYFND
jgi:excinuclease ABC subunit C